jgi:hypothetical protein
MKKIKSVEIDSSENIVCPFCKSVLLDKQSEDDYQTCDHTIFIATDDGFEYIREDMTEIINEDYSDDDIDTYTSGLKINAIRIADYMPAPSFYGVYWGFKKD